MPLFRYEVGDKSGRIMIGAMDAASEAEVHQRLTAKGYKVNAVAAVNAPQSQPAPQTRGTAVGVHARGRPTSRASAPSNELAVFFRGLASYLTAGMSIYEALMQSACQSPHSGMRVISGRMAERVQAGEKLNEAMTEFPRAFPPHVVGVTAAGELGGFLPVVVGDIALDYELVRRASSRWIEWINRMLWINAIGTFLIAPFLPIYLPMLFETGEANIGTAMTAYLKWTIPHVALPLLIVIGGYHLAAAFLRTPGMRPAAHNMLLRIPVYGRASKTRSLASFTRVLWRLQNAGILPIQAWDAASQATENVVVGERLSQEVTALRSGRKFSEALVSAGLFTGEDARFLATAESSGQTTDALQRMASYYEDAALSAAGRTKWVGLHMGIIVTLLAIGAAVICIEALPTRIIFDQLDF